MATFVLTIGAIGLLGSLIPLAFEMWLIAMRVVGGRKWLRLHGFSGVLGYTLTIPAAPDGSPGFILDSPSRSPFLGLVRSDGNRQECVIALGVLSRLVVCSVPISSLAEEWKLGVDTAGWVDSDIQHVSGPTQCQMAGVPAVCNRYTRKLFELTCWEFAHRGWVYAATLFRFTGDNGDIDALGLAVLDSWAWHDSAAVESHRTLSAGSQ